MTFKIWSGLRGGARNGGGLIFHTEISAADREITPEYIYITGDRTEMSIKQFLTTLDRSSNLRKITDTIL